MSLSRELIVAAKARADAATKGPWEAYTVPDERRKAGYVAVAADDREVQVARYEGGFFDADFIASAREDVPVMADALLRVLDLHQARGDLARSCIHCSGEESGWVSWPCATVRAVTGEEGNRG